MGDSATRPYRFGDLLALARRSWVEQMAARVAEAGYPGYRQSDAVMVRLLARGPWSVGRLGEVLGVSRQAARKFADGLVGRGHAELAPDPDDGRRTLVCLTARGEEYARAVLGAIDALNEALCSRVSHADLMAADTVLRAVPPTAATRRRLDELVAPPGHQRMP